MLGCGGSMCCRGSPLTPTPNSVHLWRLSSAAHRAHTVGKLRWAPWLTPRSPEALRASPNGKRPSYQHTASASGKRDGGTHAAATPQPKVLFRSSSPFNEIVAVIEFPDTHDEEFGDFGGSRVLVLDENPVAHSTWRPGQVVTNGCWDFYGLLPLLVPPTPARGSDLQRQQPPIIGMYGLGGGSAAILISSLFEDVTVFGWEICPAVATAAMHMGLQPFLVSGRVVAHVDDALKPTSIPSEGTFAALGVDCFQGEEPPPGYFDPATWQSLCTRVAPGGCMIINLGDHPDPDATQGLPAASSRTLQCIVEGCRGWHLYLHMETSNAMVIASPSPLDWEAIQAACPPEIVRLTHKWTPYENWAARR